MDEGRLLTVDEVLLLELLTYLPERGCGRLQGLNTYEGKTVGEWVLAAENAETERVSCKQDLCMSETDWNEVLSAIRQRSMVMELEIGAVVCDETAASALFLNRRTGEAVAAFRGTGREEWKDNFQGGGYTDAADQVSTRQQQKALDWYQSLRLEDWFVTVAGHSKGGNKAKYIAILDDTADRCLSFDGQGFSDEFMEWYGVRIRLRQPIIENHNVERDYVNVLLNPVGETVWYQGRAYGPGEFLKNHCPIAFFTYDKDGNFVMKRSDEGQERALVQVSRFVHDFLRSLSKREKYEVLNMLGTLAQRWAEGAHKEALPAVLLDARNREAARRLAMYAEHYRASHGEFAEAAKRLGLAGLFSSNQFFRNSSSPSFFISPNSPDNALRSTFR